MIADPARLRLLSLIQAQPEDEACVCHLTEPLGLSQPTVSHHLKVLLEAGLVEREQRGSWAYLASDRVERQTKKYVPHGDPAWLLLLRAHWLGDRKLDAGAQCRRRLTSHGVAGSRRAGRAVADAGGRRDRWRGLLADLGHEVRRRAAVVAHLDPRRPGGGARVDRGCRGRLCRRRELGGGALADDPERRRRAAVGGYTATAVLSSLIGVATAAWQVGALRAGGWTRAACACRRGTRCSLTSCRRRVRPRVRVRAGDGQPRRDRRAAARVGLVALVGVRTAICLASSPACSPRSRSSTRSGHAAGRRAERQPIRLRRPAGAARPARTAAIGVSAFELGNVAATLLILRATQLLDARPRARQRGRSRSASTPATTSPPDWPAYPADPSATAAAPSRVLALGVACFGIAYAGLAFAGATHPRARLLFAAAGVAIGLVETAEHAAVAHSPQQNSRLRLRPPRRRTELRQPRRERIAGLLWTTVSPRAAFLYLAGWMLASAVALRDHTRLTAAGRMFKRRAQRQAAIQGRSLSEIQMEPSACFFAERAHSGRGDRSGEVSLFLGSW